MSSHHTLHLLLTCATGLLAVLLSYYFQGFNGTDKVMEWTSNMFPLWGVSDKASTLPFRWSIIEPSEQLIFHPCFDRFEGARLQVPMNWNSTYRSDDKVAIAIVRLPAKVPVSDPQHGGLLMIQPGGPGASGVNFLLPTAHNFQKIVDGVHDEDREDVHPVSENTTKYFDLLSFDPRGINNTTPFHNCIADLEEQRSWELQSRSYIPGAPDVSFDLMWARQEAIAQSCFYHPKINPNGSKIASYMGTPTVVRDMVEIVERYGEWREEQANQSPSALKPDSLESLRWKKGEEPLRLWAMSYGSVIGATFAAMQPHRSLRLVLDAVVDSDDYYRGDWLHSVLDADSLMFQFFALCHASGPSNCSLNDNSTSPEAILQRWNKLESRLRYDGPIPVPGNRDCGPDVITWSDFKNLVWWSSYSPVTRWKTLADVLAPLIRKGDGAAFADFKRDSVPSLDHPNTCPVINATDPNCAKDSYTYRYVWQAVMCGDAAAAAAKDEALGISRDAFLGYLAALQEQSSFLGDAWSWIRFVCVGWPGRAHWRLNVPVRSDATVHPILWIGNTMDPVTPLRNAHTMASRFKGSRVLELDAEGHGSLAGPSLCAGRAIRDYFQKGTLPEDGQRCLPHSRPFVGTNDPTTEKYSGPLSKADEVLLGAMAGIKEALP